MCLGYGSSADSLPEIVGFSEVTAWQPDAYDTEFMPFLGGYDVKIRY